MGVSKAAPEKPAGEVSQNRYFSDFAQALRYWRRRRGHSQLRLSADSDISQRHISFLESGRSQPSKALILKLGAVLDIPLRQRNVMLLAAGFAPAYQERKLTDPELKSVKQALDFMLAQQSPYPALVVDRLWNLVMANQPAIMMMKWLMDMPADLALPIEGMNIVQLILDKNALGQYIVNWEDVSADLLQWIQREAMGDGPGSEATRLLETLVALPGIKAATQTPNLDMRTLPFLPMMINKNEVALSLFTSITTLGTPHDVTLHELRIENLFPADAATADWFKSRA
jgi:transcriptional regulator with XRE-family HTH domain